MKVKYKLTYEWEDREPDIIDYIDVSKCSIEEAVKNLIQWNREQFADRLNDYGMRILGLEGRFEYEVVDD